MRHPFHAWLATATMQVVVVVAFALLPGVASAQLLGSADVAGGMTDAVCKLIGPLAGSNSKILSLVFVIALAAMIFLWWLSENKEGVITWILRTGLALGVLINLFTLPSLLGLPSVCA